MPLMQTFKSYTLWASFERLSNPNTADADLALSVKAIIDHSNIVITCNGILCGVVYQQNYSPGSLDNASKVLVTISLLIVTWNRIQYEGHFMNELRMWVQQTGPLLPTLRYVVPEALLGILLILEGYKAGGAGGATLVTVLFVVLLGLGWSFSMKQWTRKEAEIGTEVIVTPVASA
ncbi:hypothetical protein DL96DRAFT_1705835 [Flagelloscypha sp. PMI_526]|nr:hypothetical protein DL96DRAFT_1705835 [Flagelloscypha sp. PMI_526]